MDDFFLLLSDLLELLTSPKAERRKWLVVIAIAAVVVAVGLFVKFSYF